MAERSGILQSLEIIALHFRPEPLGDTLLEHLEQLGAAGARRLGKRWLVAAHAFHGVDHDARLLLHQRVESVARELGSGSSSPAREDERRERLSGAGFTQPRACVGARLGQMA